MVIRKYNKNVYNASRRTSSQQSECTKFPKALYHSLAFSTCAEKTRAIAFCHQAGRDTHFPFQNSFSALFQSEKRRVQMQSCCLFSINVLCITENFYYMFCIVKGFFLRMTGAHECLLSDIVGYHAIVVRVTVLWSFCVKRYRHKL